MGIVINLDAARRTRRQAAPRRGVGAIAAPALVAGIALFTLYAAATMAVASIATAHLNAWRS